MIKKSYELFLNARSGVDSCVFLIFTTRVGLKTRLNGVKLILFEQSRVELEFESVRHPQKHIGNSDCFGSRY